MAGFINKFVPNQKHKFGRLNTPIKAAKKAGKLTRWTYDIQERFEPRVGEEIKYYKGTGTWDKSELEYVISTDGFDNMIELFNFDDDKIMSEFLSSCESDARKKYILNNDFTIAKA